MFNLNQILIFRALKRYRCKNQLPKMGRGKSILTKFCSVTLWNPVKLLVSITWRWEGECRNIVSLRHLHFNVSMWTLKSWNLAGMFVLINCTLCKISTFSLKHFSQTKNCQIILHFSIFFFLQLIREMLNYFGFYTI